MMMPDVNILVNAHRVDAVAHAQYSSFMAGLAEGPEPFALAEPVLHGFVRIVTNRKVFREPTSTRRAFAFVDEFLNLSNCVTLRAGPQHWPIFRELCEANNLTGKIVADAAHAALAIEYGCEWITADTDFARFAPLLRWRHL